MCLSSNKKQYFGITKQGVLVHKTLTGMKSNYPAYFKEVTEKLISKEFQESFITSDPTPTSALDKILTYVRSAFNLLQIKIKGSTNITEDLDDLAYSAEASKNLYDYASDGKEQEIYREILEDCGGSVELAQSKSQAKQVYKYWKIRGVESKDKDRDRSIGNGKGSISSKSITIYPEKYQLDIVKYREELFKCVKPILAAYTLSVEDLNKLQRELVDVDRKVQQSNLLEF